MSICRFGVQSDLYMYVKASDPTTVECCGCRLLGGTFIEGGVACRILDSWPELVMHVLMHEDAGHRLPSFIWRDAVAELKFCQVWGFR